MLHGGEEGKGFLGPRGHAVEDAGGDLVFFLVLRLIAVLVLFVQDRRRRTIGHGPERRERRLTIQDEMYPALV